MERQPASRALGVPSYLKLRGKTYRVKLEYGHLAEATEFLVSLIPDPLRELADEKATLETFSPEIQKALALKAMDLRETRLEKARQGASTWIHSDQGVLFLFWCMVRDYHNELDTFDKVLEKFPPGREGQLSIREIADLQTKIDYLVFGSDEALKKKLPKFSTSESPRKKSKR